MALSLFIGVVVAVALGVYIGNNPRRIWSLFKNLFSFIATLLAIGLLLALIGHVGYFSWEVITSDEPAIKTAKWIFIYIVISLAVLGLTIDFIGKVKKHGFKKGLKLWWRDFNTGLTEKRYSELSPEERERVDKLIQKRREETKKTVKWGMVILGIFTIVMLVLAILIKLQL